MAYSHLSKFSYSKLNTYDGCHFKYKLQYVDNHFIGGDSLASEFGTLIHHCEETIALAIKEGKKVNYDKLKDDFQNINIPKTSPKDTEGGIYGVNILKEKYPSEYYEVNEAGQSYYTKAQDYLSSGIYRLENYLNDNPDLRVYGVEHFFSINYNGHTLSGFIDRIFKNVADGTFIIEDIKTKGHPFKEDDLITPLQFVVYVLAIKDVLGVEEDKISCVYDLPICDIKQQAGTPGYILRGMRKLDKLFEGIESSDFKPHPTPLCYWCVYSATNPNQPEEGKGLCPYHSLWTRAERSREVAERWTGMENYEVVLKRYMEKKKAIEELDGIASIDGQGGNSNG